MKIATTYLDGNIFAHFGHTDKFKLYTVEDNKIINTEIVDTNGSGHGALVGLLSSLGVDILICGGIGMGAQIALDDADIELYSGIEGDADAAVTSYLDGSLCCSHEANCNHHDHDHGCSCGHDHHHNDHDCGCH